MSSQGPAQMDYSALVLLTPEAEPFIGELRRRHTPGGARGMPSHVTVLAPFVPPDEIDDQVADAVGSAVASSRAFKLRLTGFERFDTGVLYLTMAPVEPVRQLILSVCRSFPDLTPYETIAPDDAIPHCTVATGEEFPSGPTEQDLAVFSKAEQQVREALPITCMVDRVSLMVDTPDGWSVLRDFPLDQAV
jgi:2'-5' RNA ligase